MDQPRHRPSDEVKVSRSAITDQPRQRPSEEVKVSRKRVRGDDQDSSSNNKFVSPGAAVAHHGASKRPRTKDSRSIVLEQAGDELLTIDAAVAAGSDPCFSQLAAYLARLRSETHRAVRDGNVALCKALVSALETGFSAALDARPDISLPSHEHSFTAHSFPQGSEILNAKTGARGRVESVIAQADVAAIRWPHQPSAELVHFQQCRWADTEALKKSLEPTTSSSNNKCSYIC